MDNEIILPSKAPIFRDDKGRWKFYGVPRGRKDYSDFSAWYRFNVVNGAKEYYGGYNNLRYADARGEICWYGFDLNSRVIFLPTLPESDLVWLTQTPTN